MTARPPLDPAVARTRLAVRRAFQIAVRPGDTVCVALSGGADSLALAAAVAFEAPKLGLHTAAVTVDHGLQDNSSAVAETARDQAVQLGIARATVARVTVIPAGDGLEAAARRARYAALTGTAAQLAADSGGRLWLLTAHTRDDQAEQVLLALARGSGTRALAGITPARPLRLGAETGVDRPALEPAPAPSSQSEITLLRPFLAVSRADTEQACRALGLNWWVDPHNRDPRFLRARVRGEALPVLREVLGETVAANLARTAELARADADALDDIAGREFDRLATCDYAPAEPGTQRAPAPEARRAPATETQRAPANAAPVRVRLAVKSLAELLPAVMTRVLRQAVVRAAGSTPTSEQTAALCALIERWRGQGPSYLEGCRVAREGDEIVVERFRRNPRE